MHTVFINDKPLHFINVYDKQELELAKNQLLVSENDLTIEAAIAQLENRNDTHEIFYLSENSGVSWKLFLTYFTLIEAAGGLVQNPNGEYLIMFRHNKWDLPKGKIEYDESPEEAAIREVQEECGIGDLSVTKKLPLTFHTYILNNKRMLKKTHWFLMETNGNEKLSPQFEEDIQEVCWMDQKLIEEKVFANTYSSVGELLKNFFGKN